MVETDGGKGGLSFVPRPLDMIITVVTTGLQLKV